MKFDPATGKIPHSYGNSQPYSIGVEEEFQLLDPETFNLVPRVDELIARATEEDLRRIKPELMQSVIEGATGICSNTEEALAELIELRERVTELANASGCTIASAGTHPFGRYEDQIVTDRERYKLIIDRLRWVAQRELIFGLHVHVGIESPEKAIFIFNAIRAYLPELLALSANSPFWQNGVTGLQSTRCKVFDSFPRSGVPRSFESWEDWEQLIARSVKVGAIVDYTYIWWDVRLHPEFGTMEVRICDAQTRVADSAALAALIQATCAWLGDLFEQGIQQAAVPRLLIEENKWNASRYGLGGEFIDFATDTRVPAREAVGGLIDRVESFAQELGSAAEFAHLYSMLDATGADRQLAMYEQANSAARVAEMLVDDTCVRSLR